MYCKKHYINKGDHFRLVMFHHTLKLTNHPATIKTLEQRPRNQTSNALKKKILNILATARQPEFPAIVVASFCTDKQQPSFGSSKKYKSA